MSLYSSLTQVLAPFAAKINGLLTGYDGTVYSTPGEAVRTQINDLHVLIGHVPGQAIQASAVAYNDSNVAAELTNVNGRLQQDEAALSDLDDQVTKDVVEGEVEVETTTTHDQSDNIFQTADGYINNYGVLVSTTSGVHKTFYFQTNVDCKIYVTGATGGSTYYIGIFNDEPFVQGNLAVRTGSTYQNCPTAENPLSVSAGQYIAVSRYNADPNFYFTLNVVTTTTEQREVPTIIGAIKTRITNTENDITDIETEISGIKSDIPWKYGIDHVLCIGDSLTYGSPADSSTMPYPVSQNYPYYLGRMLGLTGDITNAGVPNYGAKTYFHNKFGQYTLSDYNAFIIFLGTNSGLTDTLDTDVNPYTDYTDFADTDTGCYCRMIEEILAAKPNAIILLVNTWHNSSVQPVTRTTIDKIGTKYSLPVVETYTVMRYGVNPIYHGGVDNVHCSKAGYLALADLVIKKLSEWFAEDTSRANKGMS